MTGASIKPPLTPIACYRESASFHVKAALVTEAANREHLLALADHWRWLGDSLRELGASSGTSSETQRAPAWDHDTRSPIGFAGGAR